MNSYSVAILSDTNRVVATSDVDWSGLRVGSFFRLVNTNQCFEITKTNKLFLIKDFQTESPKKILIKGDIGISLLVGDSILISYKEFELLTVFEITNGGERYIEGDIIYLDGGTPSLNSETGFYQRASLVVNTVGDKGTITGFGLNDNGKYLNPPPSTCPVSGGQGRGAVFQVQFQIIENRSVLERRIEFIRPDTASAELFLDYPLPAGVSQGKLSVNKWEAYLNQPIAGESRINEKFEISRDFTPVYGFPLMSKGSFTPEIIYNRFVKSVEKKIKELEDRITQLNGGK